jgi:hypothetical protein
MLSPQRRAKPLGSRGVATHLVPVGVCCVLCVVYACFTLNFVPTWGYVMA